MTANEMRWPLRVLNSGEFYQKSYIRCALRSIAEKKPGGYFRDRLGQLPIFRPFRFRDSMPVGIAKLVLIGTLRSGGELYQGSRGRDQRSHHVTLCDGCRGSGGQRFLFEK